MGTTLLEQKFAMQIPIDTKTKTLNKISGQKPTIINYIRKLTLIKGIKESIKTDAKG